MNRHSLTGLTLTIILSVAILTSVGAQQYNTITTAKRQAAKLFNGAAEAASAGDLIKAREMLIRSRTVDPLFIDAHIELSKVLYRMDSIGPSIRALENAVALDSLYQPSVLNSLSRLYELDMQYDRALRALQAWRRTPEGSRADELAYHQRERLIRIRDTLVRNPVQFDPKPLEALDINTRHDEALPRLTVDGSSMVFTRRVGRNEGLYAANTDTVANSWGASYPIEALDGEGNEGAHAVSADGRILAFTACGRPGGSGSCDIYISQLLPDGTWQEPVNFRKINTPGWDGQPALSADGTTVCYSSDRPGGLGKRDLWCATFDGESWSEPANMGPDVNSTGNESSPYLAFDERTLYFMSDGHDGMGDYDLFVSRKRDDGSWSVPENLGYPINTPGREGALSIHPDGIRAYYTKEDPTLRTMDIYEFELDSASRPVPVSFVRGTVRDADSGAPVRANVRIFDLDDPSTSWSFYADDLGRYVAALPHGGTYGMHIIAPEYAFYSDQFTLGDVEPYSAYLVDVLLQPVGHSEVSEHSPQPVVLDNVLFRSGSAVLDPVSEEELNALVTFMVANPAARIEIRGHTDNIGLPEENLRLSRQRAEAVYSWLVKSDIDAGRMSFEGFGETMPVASNDTEAGRALNRRTEFVVLKNEE